MTVETAASVRRSAGPRRVASWYPSIEHTAMTGNPASLKPAGEK